MPGSRKSDEQPPGYRVGVSRPWIVKIDGEANTVLGAVKSPSGTRCFQQSPLGRWRQGKAAVAVRVLEWRCRPREVVVACESPQHCGQQSSDGAQETCEMTAFFLLRGKRARDIRG